ncbi:uncharacterized protein LOC123871649 [Maniola jurtina]|uniref:uncharacterized protein LOC123871649 n=1 Tax=Maniola jurtina TaxID=191418 RepID=UPI001E687899|nr:uncharacterized protein LOC123871649 [Maniola jurtina]
MNWETYLPVLILLFGMNDAVRLHKLFQFLDGFKSEHDLQGFLHVGEDYAVFLQKPKPHDKFLVYELYEAKNVEENTRPRLLAISKVPVEYIKEQLKKFREELYAAKYVDNNIVPGTEVQTLREWQIDRAVDLQDGRIGEQPNILRTVVL